jgi:hypothetical protein
MAWFLLVCTVGNRRRKIQGSARKKQQIDEQPGRKRATYEFYSQNPSLRTLLHSTLHDLIAGSRGG